MAYYAALVSLIQLLKEINHPEHPYSGYVLDKQQLHLSLYEKFNHLQELLDDYSRKDHKEESADLLESRIRDAACDAQDIIESHVSNLFSEEQIEDLEKVKTNVGSTVEELMTIKDSDTTRDEDLQNKYYEELEKVKAEVDSIVEEMVRIKMESLTTQEEGLQRSFYISADSFGGAPKVEAQSGRSTMVGFKEQLIAIKEQLCGQSVKLEVISIVGTGGLGKTTLARKLFDDECIVYHFHCRAWVTVSQDYHMQKVLLNIGNSMNIMNEELSREGEQVLKEHIKKHLIGMKYLIIIDDMWDVNVWDELKMIFPDKSNGSRIMITTRVLDVAAHAGSSKFLHQMQFLNEEQSWALLRQKVFAQEHCPEELEAIGRLIAKKCRGLPLGIVVIAGVLSNVNMTQHDWEEIARNVSSVDEHLSKILSLSYNHLPHHLKPCFLYLGGFPEDHEICISKLIRLWVAEGFLKPIESKSLEEVGEEYLKDLANRNLVLLTKKKCNGKFKCCSIHDLLRDLCSQRAHSENFLVCLHQKDYENPIGNVRRVFIQTSDDSLILKYITKHYSHIRSLEYFSGGGDDFLSVTSDCKLLRILDMPYMTNQDFSFIEIVKLFHLRHLTLGVSPLDTTPSICMLQNLQTLIISGIGELFLDEIWKMPQLKHLIEREYYGLKIPPIPYGEIRIIEGVPLLGRLQTLKGVHNLNFTSDIIEMIPNLKKLSVQFQYTIYDDEAYGNWEEAGLNNLVHLYQLEKLEIYFRTAKPGILLPENFAFPSSLTKLTLYDCGLLWKEMRVVGSLPNLQILKLIEDAFVGEEWETIEGEFLKLKVLVMAQLNLRSWRVENTHFPCLEQLYITECHELEEIPSGIGDIPTLQFIEVYYCNSTVYSSAMKIQDEQRDQGNDDFQVLVVPARELNAEEDESNAEEDDESYAEEDESNAEEDESNSEEEDESNAEEDESWSSS